VREPSAVKLLVYTCDSYGPCRWIDERRGMRIRTGQRRVALLALPVVVAVSLVVAVASRASTASTCDSVDGPIVEGRQFTPYEARLSHLPELPINPSGQELGAVPPDARVGSMDGLDLRWASVSGYGAVYQYFLDTDLGPTLTVPEFIAAAGIELDRDPMIDGESFASTLLSTLGDRALRVELGNHEAALVWADPESNGIRTHHLYWSDDAYNYSLIADRSPERLVTLGRELVCNER
jgi:hypothetical protein